MKVLICGDRNWTDRELIHSLIDTFPAGTTIIVGDATGADSIAYDIALEHGFTVMRFDADWETLGKAAGPIRNAWMLRQRPDIIYAFHDNLKKSKGTRDCLLQAKKLGIPVKVRMSDVR